MRPKPPPAVRIRGGRNTRLAVTDQRQSRTIGGARSGHSTSGSEPGYHASAGPGRSSRMGPDPANGSDWEP